MPTPAELAAAEGCGLLDLIDQSVADLTEQEIEQRLRETLRAAGMLAEEQ